MIILGIGKELLRKYLAQPGRIIISAVRDDQHAPLTEEQLRLLNPPQPSAAPQRNGIPQMVQRRMSKDGYSWEEDPG